MKKLIMILFLALLAGQAYGAGPFYVKTGGSDAADGLSDGNAWETQAKAATTVAVGETVYFQAGDTWTEAWTMFTASPTQESERITIGSYGAGANPIFKQPNASNSALYIDWGGKDFFTVENVTFDANGAGQASGDNNLATFNGSTNLIFDGVKFMGASRVVALTHGTLFTSSSDITLTDCVWEDIYYVACLLTNTDTVTITRPTISDVGGGIILYEDSDDITITDPDISNAAAAGKFLFYPIGSRTGGWQYTGTGFTVSGGSITDPGQLVDGIDISRFDDAGAGTTEMSITGVRFDGGVVGFDTPIVVQDFDETGGDSILVSGNDITHGEIMGIALFGSDSATITKNKITHGGTIGTYGPGIYVSTSTGAEYPTDLTISENIIDGHDNGIVFVGASGKTITGVKLHNNTVVNLRGHSVQTIGYTTIAEIYNNIFSGIAASHSFFNIDANSDITAVNFNRYYDDADIRWTYHGSVPTDIATWRTLISDDGDSSVGDPLLNGYYPTVPGVFLMMGVQAPQYGLIKGGRWGGGTP